MSTKKINKIEELINRLDPNRYQCHDCGKWINIRGDGNYTVYTYDHSNEKNNFKKILYYLCKECL